MGSEVKDYKKCIPKFTVVEQDNKMDNGILSSITMKFNRKLM